MSDISSRMLSIILAKDISYGELSERTGISKSALQRYATGQTEKIPIDRLQKIAIAIGTTAAELMGWTDSTGPKEPREDTVESDFLGEMDIAFYGDYRELSDADREILHEMARVMRNRQLDIKRKPSEETTQHGVSQKSNERKGN